MKTLMVVLGMILAFNIYAETYESLLKKGQKLNAGRKQAEAVEVLKKAVELGKNNVERSSARLHLADSYIATKDYEKANEVLKEVVKLDDTGIYIKGGGLCKQGQVYLLMKKYPEAEASLKEAKSLFPETNLPVEFAFGELSFAQEKYPEAIKQYEVVAVNPKANKYLKAGAIINQGRAYMKLNQPEKAKEKFKKVINSTKYSKVHKDYAKGLLKQIK